MIDDKKDNKIEEAAYKFATSQTHGELLALIDGYKEGYKDATNELLNDLWHPASEMPDKNRICLVRVVYHLNHGMLQDEERIEQSSFHDFGWYDYDFKYIGHNYDIISWLYVDDLLPKEGGEK